MNAFGTLEPHQLDSLQWMIALDENNMNGLLADDMGLGKTIQTISIICYLWETKNVRQPHLIIAPKSTIPNWMKEFRRWAPELRVVHLIPTQEHRDVILKTKMGTGQFDVCVTTYEAIKNVPQLSNTKFFNWYLLCFDEAHKLKARESQIALRARAVKSVRRLLLTGTPLQNDIMELWNLLNFLMPEIFINFEEFENWFSFSTGKQQDAQSAQISEGAKFMII